MKIVLADDDTFTRELLVRTLEARTSHQITAVADGHQALELALSDDPPDALLLDWMMPTMTGTEVCRRVRAAPLKRQPYILLVTAKNQRNELVEGLSVGADDLLSKPVPPDVLLARIHSAERQRRGRRGTSSHVQRALLSARAEGSGELVVRDGDITAHVYFQEGAVAWAHISDDRNVLFELLSSGAQLDKETARAVLEECRQSGAPLSDTLVRWGLTDRASLRNSLQLWISKKLSAIIDFTEPETLFLPSVRRYADDMLFDLHDVVPGLEAAAKPSLPPAAREASIPPWDVAFVEGEGDAKTTKLLERLMSCEGVRGAVILDRAFGYCLGQSGAPLNPHIAWALLQSVSVVSRHTAVDDAVVSTPPDFHFIQVLRDRPNQFAYVLVDGRKVLLGAARLKLREAIDAAS
jgi:DNA-binding response OmpR family regulator